MKKKGSRNKKGVKRILTKFGYYDVFEPSHPMAKSNGYVREHRMVAYDAGILTDPSMEVLEKQLKKVKYPFLWPVIDTKTTLDPECLHNGCGHDRNPACNLACPHCSPMC